MAAKAFITLNRPNGMLYGCRFGAFLNENYNSVYVDDYDIGQTAKMIYNYAETPTSNSYNITYTDANAIVTENSSGNTLPVRVSYTCFVLYNRNTVKVTSFSNSIDGSSVGGNVLATEYNILDGKIINDDGSINQEYTTMYEDILSNSDSSKYLHNAMKINTITLNGSDFKSQDGISTIIRIDEVDNSNVLSLKFKDFDGNTMRVSDITSDESNKNLVVESDRYEQGYYLNLGTDSTFKYVTGDPDRYVPNFNLKWRIPTATGEPPYMYGLSYFGAYVKYKDGKFVCISQPTIYQSSTTPIQYVTFPIELYTNKNLYYEENGSIPIYLVRFKGFYVEQDIFKTNMINSVTDFIKTY